MYRSKVVKHINVLNWTQCVGEDAKASVQVKYWHITSVQCWGRSAVLTTKVYYMYSMFQLLQHVLYHLSVLVRAGVHINFLPFTHHLQYELVPYDLCCLVLEIYIFSLYINTSWSTSYKEVICGFPASTVHTFRQLC